MNPAVVATVVVGGATFLAVVLPSLARAAEPTTAPPTGSDGEKPPDPFRPEPEEGPVELGEAMGPGIYTGRPADDDPYGRAAPPDHMGPWSRYQGDAGPDWGSVNGIKALREYGAAPAWAFTRDLGRGANFRMYGPEEQDAAGIPPGDPFRVDDRRFYPMLRGRNGVVLFWSDQDDGLDITSPTAAKNPMLDVRLITGMASPQPVGGARTLTTYAKVTRNKTPWKDFVEGVEAFGKTIVGVFETVVGVFTKIGDD